MTLSLKYCTNLQEQKFRLQDCISLSHYALHTKYTAYFEIQLTPGITAFKIRAHLNSLLNQSNCQYLGLRVLFQSKKKSETFTFAC